MSLIFGIVNFNDRSDTREAMVAMKSALNFWGPDAQNMWIDGDTGLGNLLLYNTPESVFENLPSADDSGNLVLTAAARIDNRNELNRIFGITPQEAMHLPDSHYIMKAYQRWGDDCPEHLLGDWAFAIWNKSEKKLYVARDHHGVTALYYYLGKDFFIFSSSLKGILCFKEIEKKVNEYKIAQILIGWNEGGRETCYQDIYRLPPAHTLILQNNQITANRYWHLENTPELHLKDDQQYIDLFMDIYSESVKCRLRSYHPVGATLSGGLDSGSVCALAAHELKKKGKRLSAFTAVPLYDTTGIVPPNRIGDEGPLAQAVADHCGNIDITFCKAENIGPLEAIDEFVKIHDEPMHFAANAFWILDIINKAKYNSIGTMLTGQAGNWTVSWPVNYFKSSYSNKIIKYYCYNSRAIKKRWLNKSILNPDLIKKLNFYSHLSRGEWDPFHSPQPTFDKFRINNFISIETKSQISFSILTHSYKVEFRDPTIDSRIIDYLVTVPEDFYKCQDRKFVKVGFQNILSDASLKNKKRGLQSSDLFIRQQNEGKDLDISYLNNFVRQEVIQKPDVMNRASYRYYAYNKFLEGLI